MKNEYPFLKKNKKALELIKNEIDVSKKPLKHLRYLAEIKIRVEHPSIHYIAIERRSCLLNFRISLSGSIFIVGTCTLVFGIIKSINEGIIDYSQGIIGTLLIFLGLYLFKSIPKEEEQLKLSIWRVFQAIKSSTDKKL